MGLRTAFRRLLGTPGPAVGPVERRAINSLPWDTGGPNSIAAVSAERALALVPVYASVRLIADQVASLPLYAYRKTATGFVQLPLVPTLFQKPSVIGHRYDWLFRMVTSLALRGNAYGLITGRDRLDYPTGVEWLHPDEVVVLDQAPSGPGSFTDPLYFWQGRRIEREDIVHMALFVLPGRVKGLSPIEACMAAVATGLSAQDYTANWFLNGAVPPGQFRNSEEEVDPDQAEIIRNRLTSAIRSRKPLVYGRQWTYEPISVAQHEAKFIETLKLTATNIACIYGVPPDMVGGDVGASGLTYKNTANVSLDFVKFTLRPWLERAEEAFTELTPRGQYMRFNLDALLRADLPVRMAAYQTARTIGLMSINECRALEDLPPVDGGDDHTPLAEQQARTVAEIQREQQVQVAEASAGLDSDDAEEDIAPDADVADEAARYLASIEATRDGAVALRQLAELRYDPTELVLDDAVSGELIDPDTWFAVRAHSPAGFASTEQLHHYWTAGPGLAKWAEAPDPWTQLYHHLLKYIPNAGKAKRTAAAWFHDVFHFWPGSDLNRVTHGKPPRGKKVGPG